MPPTPNASSAPPPPPSPSPPAWKSLLTKVWEFVWPPTGPHLHQTEWAREVVETVVFVVVLVLLLKSFAAEAFVIPTGSMAETLWGYQKVVKCPRCNYVFPVNCSDEVEKHMPVTSCVCPNCLYYIDRKDRVRDGDVERPVIPTGYSSGDRVLVGKSLWETGLVPPRRFDVTVFKFPGESGGGDRPFPRSGPEKDLQAMNYIKRMIGIGKKVGQTDPGEKPGETIGIYYGNLYYNRTLDEPDAQDLEAPEVDRWKLEYTHPNRFHQLLLDHDERLKILRKPPEKVLAMKRLVYDNDFQASDLTAFPRWAPEKAGEWVGHEPHGFRSAASGTELAWLRYTHLVRKPGNPLQVHRQLITDLMGYNTGTCDPGALLSGENWVGELILECEVTVDQPQGSLVLELAKGVDRFRAVWDLATGDCALRRLNAASASDDAKLPEEKKGKQLGDTRPTPLKGKGTFHVRFANVDDRLTVWVNGGLPFGDGVEYDGPGPDEMGPRANDLQPVNVGVGGGGAVTVEALKLWRDTYYTQQPSGGCSGSDGLPEYYEEDGRKYPDWGNPEKWAPLHKLPARTMYVQPGHYLCLGDNSPHSSDGRSWGLVPERLLLGRALLVYYPFWAPFPPFEAPVNRVGPIR